jgi:hypothetical protein
MRNLTKQESDLYFLFFKTVALLRNSYEDVFIPLKIKIESESIVADGIKFSHVVSAMSAITAVIDSLARTVKVSRKLSGVSQKGEQFKEYLHSQSWVVEARNNVQHINEQVRKDNSGPILGSVLWCNGPKHYILSLNDHQHIKEIPGLIIDTHTEKALIEIAYVYNERYLDIKAAYEGALEFYKFIKASFILKDEHGNELDSEGGFIGMVMEVQFNNQA